jgi:formylglycine-generating enzyme required for sulfatase activity
VKGLLLARRALDASARRDLGARDTLAWALFRVGRLDEGLAEERRYLDESEDDRKGDVADYLRRMEAQVATWRGPKTRRREEAARLAARVAELEVEVNARRTYEFDSREDDWWQEQLARLVADLRAFTDEKQGGLDTAGSSEVHGWGIVRRAELARSIRERSVSGPEAANRWSEAVASIAASPKYGGLRVTPQIGLLPIGEDQDSHLWEFAHLATGEPAARGTDGKLALNESTGLVFVLIPGGSFWMGAQRTDPSGLNYDLNARDAEAPVHEVELSPYFISKYEMTQGQWERFTHRNPSEYESQRYVRNWNRAGKGWSPLHPVEQVSWNDCARTLGRLGLELPSEAQWEYAARGGTSTPWWTGTDVVSLAGAANVADAYGKTHGHEISITWDADLDDGNTMHAEIGSYRANPFGLHDVVGNVMEWCLDVTDGGFYAVSPRKDPVARGTPIADRALRGGDFGNVASSARSAFRAGGEPENHGSGTGVRPARALVY